MYEKDSHDPRSRVVAHEDGVVGAAVRDTSREKRGDQKGAPTPYSGRRYPPEVDAILRGDLSTAFFY